MKFLSNEEYKERINQKASLNHTIEKRHCKFTNTTESDLRSTFHLNGKTGYHEEFFKKLLFNIV